MNTTLQHLADRAEITDLVNRLGAVLDEGRFAEMRWLLVEEATARTPGGQAEGREAMIAQASRNHDPDQPIQHLITNLTIDVDDDREGERDGDRASVRANLVAHFGPVGGAGGARPIGTPAGRPLAPPVEFTMGEVYHFGLVRTGDGWRFDRIETTPVWTAGTFPLPTPAPTPA